MNKEVCIGLSEQTFRMTDCCNYNILTSFEYLLSPELLTEIRLNNLLILSN